MTSVFSEGVHVTLLLTSYFIREFPHESILLEYRPMNHVTCLSKLYNFSKMTKYRISYFFLLMYIFIQCIFYVFKYFKGHTKKLPKFFNKTFRPFFFISLRYSVYNSKWSFVSILPEVCKAKLSLLILKICY